MNREKLTNSTLSKAPGWNKILIIGFIVALGIINFGCQCDCEEATDEYYVKYEVYSDAPFEVKTLHTIVNNENNNDVSFTF